MASYDTATNFNATGTSASVNVTVTGTNPTLLFAFRNNTDTTDAVTSVTYNGVAMTQLHKTSNIGNGTDYGYIYILVGAATGTNALVINSSASKNYLGATISYTGTLQTGQPDASSYTDSNTSDPVTKSITPVASGCWAIICGITADPSWTGGTGVTNRIQGSGGVFWGDSNGSVAAGSAYSMTISGGGTRTSSVWLLTLAPIPSAANPAFLLNFMT